MERIRHSIAIRLLKIVFSFYIFLTVALTLIHMYAEYVHSREGVFNELQSIQQTFAPGLAAALWDLNLEQLKPTFLGMVDFPTVVGVKIIGERGELLGMAGEVFDENDRRITVDHQGTIEQSPNGHLYEHKAPIVYTHRGEPISVGTAVLYSSPAVVLQKVKLSFIIIVVNAIIKTAVFWIIFLIVARKILLLPLHTLIEITRRIGATELAQTHFQLENRPPDELSELAHAFNDMTQRLATTQQRYQDLNVSLEQKVMERTQALEQASRKLERISRLDGARNERLRIIRDLHDDVGGHIVSLMLNASDEKQRDLARNALQALRDTITTLDDQQERQLVDFLDHWVTEAQERLSVTGSQLDIMFASSDVAGVILNARQNINLRRVLDEALINAIKHAHPSILHLAVIRRGKRLHITLSNDGLPATTAVIDPVLSQGRGLHNMRTRIAELGGELNCGPDTDNTHYRVALSIPLT